MDGINTIFDEVKENESLEEMTSKDFEVLLDELNKQVSNADGSINELLRKRDTITQDKKDLENRLVSFEEERISFDKKMKEEYQQLNDQKTDFEQEKTRVFNEIQEAREDLSRKSKEFEKYRQEQLEIIKNSKKMLTKNYEQFEKIVSTFNDKIDSFN